MMENTTFRPLGDPTDTLGGRRAGRESLIDQECFFEGTFRTPGNLRIEGTYQGVVECHGTLTIAESGRVNARILAGCLIVAGQLTGEAQCENRFEIVRSGQVTGAVYARTVVVHDGAYFEGEIRMGGSRPADEAPGMNRQAGGAAPRVAQTAPARALANSQIASAVPATQPVRRRQPSPAREDGVPLTTGEAGAEFDNSESPESALAGDLAPAVTDARTNGRSQNVVRDGLPNQSSES
jgi:cytoskeletal protein CcmA (bactofilin family)